MDKFGLTEYGFKRKTYNDILSDMEAKARELYGDNVNLSERSPLGLFLKIIAWKGSETWQLAEDVYNSAYIDTAEGVSQDNASKYVTIQRKPAQKAKGTVVITGNEGTIVPLGFMLSTDADEILFETTKQAIIPSEKEIEIPITAVEPGEKGNVPASTITEIVNPIAGVSEVVNLKETEGGTDTESDYEFRERYYRSLSKGGSSTREAVEAALLDMDDVIDAFVDENDIMEYIDDIPPKSLAPYVFGGEDIEVAETILKSKAGGIRSYGETEISVKDSKGEEHTIGFSRAETIDIYVNIQLHKIDGYVGDDEIKKVIIKYIGGQDKDGKKYKGLKLGETVVLSKIIAATMTYGVEDVFIRVSSDGKTYDTRNIKVGKKQLARTSWDKVVINYV